MADDALSLSPQDRDLMIRTVIGEANGDASAPAVAHVILNRARNNGQSVKDVVLAKGQFEPWSTRSSELLSYAPTDPAYKKAAQIVDAASTGAIPDPTNGATKFYAPKAQAALGRNPPKWDDGTGQQIGAHKFFGGSTPDLLGQWGNGAQPSQSAPAQDETPDILGSWQSAPSSPTQVPIAPTPAAAAAPGIVNLAANPNDTATDTAAKALGTTAIKGVSHVPGFLGDIADTADYLGARITSKIKGIPVEQAMAEHNARLNALANSNEPDAPLVRSYLAARSAIPSGQDIQNKVLGTNGAYQPTSTLGKYGMMAGEMGIGGGLLGAGALPSAAVGTAGNALAEATGEPLAALAVGAASPAVARIGGYGVRAAGNAIANTPPGARAIATHFGDIGITPAEAETRLTAMGPEAMPADIDPATTRLAGQLAARGGPAATSVLEGEMKQRSAGADERMHAAIEDALGPKPNAQEILGNIRQKEEDLAFDPKVARSVLNESMGEAQDPHAVLQTMLAKRSADAQPLYEKAMQGGSIAPLESQFQNA
jgi:hypothetical protein